MAADPTRLPIADRSSPEVNPDDRPPLALIDSIRTGAAAVRRQIDDATRAAGRNPDDVHLIAVTKFFPPQVAAAACAAGLQDLGENRVQELLAKQDALTALGLTPRWHLIGTLQRNKVKYILGRTHLIHSGDSIELLAEISRRSVIAGVETAVLLQLNPAREESKHGFAPDTFPQAAAMALRLPALHIAGVMAMAPFLENPEDTRPFFQASADLFQELCRLHHEICPDRLPPDTLSMGMSHDYVQAIACGATHVRIGTAIFGQRPAPV